MKRITTDHNKGRLSLVPKKSKSCPFSELVHEWIEYLRLDGCTPKTLQDHANKVDKFRWWWVDYPSAPDGTSYADRLGAHPENVTTAHARAFASYLKTPTINRWGIKSLTTPSTAELSAESVISYGRTVKAFFNWLAADGQEHIDRSPFTRAVKFGSRHQKDRTIKVVEPAAQDKIFEVLTDPLRLDNFAGKRNLALIALLVDSGIRRGELINLRIEDIDIGKKRFVVTGKTGTRVAYFGDKCRNSLVNYMQEPLIVRQKPNMPLWWTVDGVPLTYNGVAGIIRKIEQAAGVEFHAHMLRHSFATSMAQSGVEVYDLMRMMGHENLQTTMVYVNYNPEHLQELHRVRSPLDQQDKVEIKRRGRPRKQE